MFSLLRDMRTHKCMASLVSRPIPTFQCRMLKNPKGIGDKITCVTCAMHLAIQMYYSRQLISGLPTANVTPSDLFHGHFHFVVRNMEKLEWA